MFDLPAYLEQCRRDVDDELNRLLPLASAPPTILHEAMRYSVFAGGKRIRPAIAFGASLCVSGTPDPARLIAAGIECLHTYTLIHDDLPCMDDDDWRRGRPSCHKAYGEANALLAGDALQALAFGAVAGSPGGAEAVRRLAAATGSMGVVGGQVADLAADTRAGEPELMFIHEHKTADLIAVAAELGALSAGASPKDCRAFRAYGRATGLAFQLVDDLLDHEPPGTDAFSSVRILGADGVRARITEWTRSAIVALASFGDRATPLVALAHDLEVRTS